MSIEAQIEQYILSLSEPKRTEMQTLHEKIDGAFPGTQRWYEDGKNSEGKIVSNPNVGYGCYTIQYANGSSREFYRVGISANTSGISVYIMGLKDKNYLSQAFAHKLGKAKISGYCIKFKSLKDIDIEILMQAIQYGMDYAD